MSDKVLAQWERMVCRSWSGSGYSGGSILFTSSGNIANESSPFLPQSPRTPIAAAGGFRRRGARRRWKPRPNVSITLPFGTLVRPTKWVKQDKLSRCSRFPIRQGDRKFAEVSGPPWGWTYVRFFHVSGVVDSRNSGLTLANVPIVPDPVAQQG